MPVVLETFEVIVSAKCARLAFQGCSPDYIANVCHGRCCWIAGKGGKPTTTLFSEPDQRIQLTLRGAVIGGDGIVENAPSGKCPFQTVDTGLCSIHNERSPAGMVVKPRNCYISPWILSKRNKLIIRNRYKLLGCYKAAPAIPAYKAFFSGLVMLFGAKEAGRISEHFDRGGGDCPAKIIETRAALVKKVVGKWNADYYGGRDANH